MPRIMPNAVSMFAMVSGATAPSRSKNRLRATALIPRDTATLDRSTPSLVDTSGLSGDGARELDTGMTTSNSSGTPVLMSSTDITTTGRFLPGSPLRAAPRETSHNSPRRGSVDAIGERGLPFLVLHPSVRPHRSAPPGVTLGLEERVSLRASSHLRQQRGNRQATCPCLLSKQITGFLRHSDRRSRHIASLWRHHKATT